ncbi:alpha-amylase [Thermosipho ferrireducens]|uniref:Alpha-amylase n=1 Tax=Thermosipho ferrireducens TaxID=2571116 RepID=A0ABX7S7A1_9BACT|nr:alpha-amylase family glycosyl hydrolase [Thermosipho ferrireducens]QTA38084.1 alpha-amylase [Thermosipho ferrireducens]
MSKTKYLFYFIIFFFLFLLPGCVLNFAFESNTSNVIYEIFVRSFYDSNGDGIGDFSGIARKVDYLVELGIDAVWLMPFNEAISYHGYDVVDYYTVEKDYGTMEDFEKMIGILHENGIKIIMDLVINHTSDKHPWFLDAIENLDSSPYWNWYFMSLEDHSGKANWHYKFNSKGQKVWYFGLFGPSMPDLNHDNPYLRNEIKKIVKFWLNKGIDGFRLDAAKHIYGWTWDDGIEQSAEYWKWFRNYVFSIKKDAGLVGEVFSGDALQLEKFPIPVFNFVFRNMVVSNYEGADSLLKMSLSWTNGRNNVPFLGNHDLNRILSVFQEYYKDFDKPDDSLKQSALWHTLLLTISGTPVLYYGDELGTPGFKWFGPVYDEPLREPFQWYASGTGKGQTKWTKWLYSDKKISFGNANVDGCIYDDPYDGVSVEEQESETYSMLNYIKTLINLRKRYKAFSIGDMEIIADKKNLIVYRRIFENEKFLVVINPSSTSAEYFEFPVGSSLVFKATLQNFTWEELREEISGIKLVNPREVIIIRLK